MLVCGWDGGGTKTKAVVEDADGREVLTLSSGPLNLNGNSPETVRGTVRELMAGMRGAGECERLVIGMAGISNPASAGLIRDALREEGYTGSVRLCGDQEIALAGAMDTHGVILIAGTGSIAFGRDARGGEVRVGGYGYIMDDPGSGYAIGRDILSAVVRSHDGRRGKTCLAAGVFDKLGIRDITELVGWVYAPDTGKKEIASLAALLPSALAEGDTAAREIAERAAEELADMALAALRRPGMEGASLALTGSILEHMTPVREGVTSRIRGIFPDMPIGSPREDPAHGAARMALASL